MIRLLLFTSMMLAVLSCSRPAKPSHSSERVPTQSSSITQDEEYTIQTYRVENDWGYDILRNNQLFVHQPNIPAISGEKGFNTEEQAISVAQLMIEKLKKGISPPSVSLEELDSLKVLH